MTSSILPPANSQPERDDLLIIMQPDAVKVFWTTAKIQLSPFNPIVAIPGNIYRALDIAGVRYLLNKLRDHHKLECMAVRDPDQDRYLMGPKTTFPAHCLIYASPADTPVLNTALLTASKSATDVAIESDEDSETEDSEAALTPLTDSVTGPDNSANAVADTPTPESSTSTKSASGSRSRSKSDSDKVKRPRNAFMLYRQDRQLQLRLENPGIHNKEVSKILGKRWQNERPEVVNEYKGRAERIKEEHALKYPGYQYRPRRASEKKRRITRKQREEQQRLQELNQLDKKQPFEVTAAALGDIPNTSYDNIPEIQPSHFYRPDYSALSGPWAGIRHGVLPARPNDYIMFDTHNESITDSVHGNPYAMPGSVGAWRPTNEWIDVQQTNYEDLNWPAIADDMSADFIHNYRDTLNNPTFAIFDAPSL